MKTLSYVLFLTSMMSLGLPHGAEAAGNRGVATDSVPSVETIHQRALALASVAYRVSLEGAVSSPATQGQHQELLRYVKTNGLPAALEPEEAKIVDAPLGTVDRREGVNASWRAEGMAVLAWALGPSPLPSYDQPVNAAQVAEGLGFLQPESPPTDVEGVSRLAIERLEAHLRTVAWRIQRQLETPGPVDLATFARGFGADVANLRILDGDLSVDGKPLDKVERNRLFEVRSIATERLRAARWLLGKGKAYSEIDLTVEPAS